MGSAAAIGWLASTARSSANPADFLIGWAGEACIGFLPLDSSLR